MEKRKFNLTNDLIKEGMRIPLEKNDDNQAGYAKNMFDKANSNPPKKVNLLVGASEAFRTELKIFCAQHNLTMGEAFEEAFGLLKDKYKR